MKLKFIYFVHFKRRIDLLSSSKTYVAIPSCGTLEGIGFKSASHQAFQLGTFMLLVFSHKENPHLASP